jgi:hypothetical protein
LQGNTNVNLQVTHHGAQLLIDSARANDDR